MSVAELKDERGSQELQLLSQASPGVGLYNLELHFLQCASAFVATGELIRGYRSEATQALIEFGTTTLGCSPSGGVVRLDQNAVRAPQAHTRLGVCEHIPAECSIRTRCGAASASLALLFFGRRLTVLI